MKLLKQDITLSLCFSLCSSHSPTRIKVASTRLMLRNVNVLLLHAVTCVNSSKVTYPLFDAGVVGNVGLDCENRGSSLLQTRLMLRISLFFSVSLSLSLSLSFSYNTYVHILSLALIPATQHPTGYPNRKVPPGRSFSWGPYRIAVIDTKSQTHKRRK